MAESITIVGALSFSLRINGMKFLGNHISFNSIGTVGINAPPACKQALGLGVCGFLTLEPENLLAG